ncbi:ABC transporter substrate-binding protein [Clostridium sediminicola]|uniref:ABC transporter substrate-binding protein n=1 Tax=Clostridium sediminicola TaxID=3114879 RepID=UPI0031F1E3D3
MVGKKVLALLCSSLLVTSLIGCSGTTNEPSGGSEEKEVIEIGVTQIVEHPALDASREGFVAALKENGYEEGKNVEYDFQNAQGDMPTTQTIAKKFVDDKVDMIYAISTPSAQAAFNATKEIPIVITAVTDPVGAGLVESLESPGGNVTGKSGASPMDKQFQFIKDELPNIKTIGIMYNTSESNSEVQVKRAIELSKELGIEIIQQGITSVNDIPQTLNSILDKIDALYVQTDNMIVSSMPIVSKICFENNKPIIGSESSHVANGAIIAIGIDYFQLGHEAGMKAVEVLEGKMPKDIPVTTQKESSIHINTDALEKLNIEFSEEIMNKATKITGGIQ